MPTFLSESGFTITIPLRPHAHAFPYVHVRKDAEEMVVALEPVSVLRSEMNQADACAAVRLVEVHAARLLTAWRASDG